MIVELNPATIKPNPYQPRQHIDEDEIDQLARSIEQDGLMQPVAVYKSGEDYVLLFGQRRLLAHRKLKLDTISAIVREGDPMELSIIENLQRIDLSPLDVAEALARLRDERELTLDQIGERISKAKSTVSELLAIASLPDEIKELIRTSEHPISKSILIEVTRLDDPSEQRALIDQARAGATTVRAAREQAQTGVASRRPEKTPVVRMLASCKTFGKRLEKIDVESEIEPSDFEELLGLQADLTEFIEAARKKHAKLRKVTVGE